MSLTTPQTRDDGGLTLADLEAMPDDGRRYELIGGAIVVTAAPNTAHQRALGNLHLLLRAVAPPGHEVFLAPFDVDLPFEQRVEPDLILVPLEHLSPQRVVGPTTLLVEILSPGTRRHDLVTKRDTYQDAGVPHYWIIDPANEVAIVLDLVEGVYIERACGPVVTVEHPVALTIDVAQLVEPPR